MKNIKTEIEYFKLFLYKYEVYFKYFESNK